MCEIEFCVQPLEKLLQLIFVEQRGCSPRDINGFKRSAVEQLGVHVDLFEEARKIRVQFVQCQMGGVAAENTPFQAEGDVEVKTERFFENARRIGSELLAEVRLINWAPIKPRRII